MYNLNEKYKHFLEDGANILISLRVMYTRGRDELLPVLLALLLALACRDLSEPPGLVLFAPLSSSPPQSPGLRPPFAPLVLLVESTCTPSSCLHRELRTSYRRTWSTAPMGLVFNTRSTGDMRTHTSSTKVAVGGGGGPAWGYDLVWCWFVEAGGVAVTSSLVFVWFLRRGAIVFMQTLVYTRDKKACEFNYLFININLMR